MDIDSGNLRMQLDNGWVRRRIDEGDGRDIRWEDVGPIFDEGACPWECREDWAYLKDRFYDATRAGDGHEAAVAFSYYDRFSTPRMN